MQRISALHALCTFCICSRIDLYMAIDAKTKPLAEILRNGSFRIPNYQRPYDWPEDNVDEFLVDMETCAKAKRPHFLGTIVLVPVPNASDQFLIVDGQQRIVTFGLICANLCKSFRDSGDTYGEKTMMRLLFCLPEGLERPLDDANDCTPRVLMPDHDKTNYEAILRGGMTSRNSKMNKACRTIETFLDKNSCNLVEITDFLQNKLFVVKIKVDSEIDSISVFESLNARGKPLSQVHLIRAYIYSYFNAQGNQQQNLHIEKGMNNLQTVLDDDKGIEEYLKCQLLARYGYMQSKRLYRSFKEKINQQFPSKASRRNEIFAFVNKVFQGHRIEIFNIIRKKGIDTDLLKTLNRDSRNNRRNRTASDYLNDMRKYHITYPIIFALLCKYLEKEDPDSKKRYAKLAVKAFKLLASFVQRASHTGAFRPHLYEENFANLAKDILHDTCSTIDSFWKILEKCDKQRTVVSDRLYIDNLKQKSFTSTIEVSKAGYILARVSEMTQDVRDEKWCVEHILPQGQKFLRGWKGFTRETHNVYVHRLGNLTLLREDENKSSQEFNANFAEKKVFYKKSAYDITKKLASKKVWVPKSIEARQKELAELAAGIWNFRT